MKSFKDTLNAWLARDIKGVRYLRTHYWRISDAVFFNKDKSKCLLLLASINPDTAAFIDQVQIIGAEKINEHWQFYLQSYPTPSYDREQLKPRRPFTFEELFNYEIRDIVIDGYVIAEGMVFKQYKINYSYIDSDIWFADWMRKMHYDVFLKSKW